MPSFEPRVLLSVVGHLLAAFVLALPTAYERERATGTLGLRTFPLVALASCAYILIAIHISSGDPNANSRVVQGLITGIGFIGGGAILKGERGVSGTATAASIWTTGALGAAVGYGAFEIAIALGVMNFLVLRLLRGEHGREKGGPRMAPGETDDDGPR